MSGAAIEEELSEWEAIVFPGGSRVGHSTREIERARNELRRRDGSTVLRARDARFVVLPPVADGLTDEDREELRREFEREHADPEDVVDTGADDTSATDDSDEEADADG